MATINPYLTFNGNCEEAFTFYKSIFGGEYSYMGRFGEMPQEEGYTLSDSEKNKIMHIGLPISKTDVLMGSDTMQPYNDSYTVGNNVTISVGADTKEEADKLYAGLAEGGKPTMPMNDTFWGSYFGMLTDKFGVHWMISFDQQQKA